MKLPAFPGGLVLPLLIGLALTFGAAKMMGAALAPVNQSGAVGAEGAQFHGAAQHPIPAISQCGRCHVDAFHSLAESPHGVASVGCQSCHELDRGATARLFQPVTKATCARCHAATVQAWREGRHVGAFDFLRRTVGAAFGTERAKEVPINPAFRGMNNCLACHRPHRFR